MKKTKCVNHYNVRISQIWTAQNMLSRNSVCDYMLKWNEKALFFLKWLITGDKKHIHYNIVIMKIPLIKWNELREMTSIVSLKFKIVCFLYVGITNELFIMNCCHLIKKILFPNSCFQIKNRDKQPELTNLVLGTLL